MKDSYFTTDIDSMTKANQFISDKANEISSHISSEMGTCHLIKGLNFGTSTIEYSGGKPTTAIIQLPALYDTISARDMDCNGLNSEPGTSANCEIF